MSTLLGLQKNYITREQVFEMIFAGNAMEILPESKWYLGLNLGKWVEVQNEGDVEGTPVEITRERALELVDKLVEARNAFFSTFNTELEWAASVTPTVEVVEEEVATEA